MTRIDDTFTRLRARGQKAFVAYIMAGDPDLETSLSLTFATEALPGALPVPCLGDRDEL